MTESSIERRRFKRIFHGEPIQFSSKNAPEPMGSLSRDLSSGGIQLSLNDFVPLGTEMELKVTLRTGAVLDCQGKVVWVRQVPFSDRYQAGLEFIAEQMDLVSRNKIHQYIHQSE